MTEGTCGVDECDKPIKRAGFCYSHYMRNWRYGTPTPEFSPRWVDVTGKRYGALVVRSREGQRWLCDCDCGQTRLVSAGELNREGDANSCGDMKIHRRSDSAGYVAAHDRCRRDKGPIKSHVCIDCGAPAQHWSYDHGDPDQLLAYGLSTRPIAYSLDPDHYQPRCVSCHKVFDLGRIDSFKVQ